MANQFCNLAVASVTERLLIKDWTNSQMPENRSYSKPVVKSIVQELTPPFVWRALQRAIVRATDGGEAGRERPSDYYDAQYEAVESYHRHYADSPYFFLWCVVVDRIPADARCVFDIGCGPGQLAAFLHHRGLHKYVGLDFSNVGISIARSLCPSYEFVCADVFKSDLFRTLDYDVVVSTEFLEHVEHDLEILDRIRSGTRVLGSLPNFPHRSHVRYFNSTHEVYQRYSSRFTGFRIDEFPFGSGGMSFFVFEGIRSR